MSRRQLAEAQRLVINAQVHLHAEQAAMLQRKKHSLQWTAADKRMAVTLCRLEAGDTSATESYLRHRLETVRYPGHRFVSFSAC